VQEQLFIVLNLAYILSVTHCKVLHKMSRIFPFLFQFRIGKHHLDTIPQQYNAGKYN